MLNICFVFVVYLSGYCACREGTFATTTGTFQAGVNFVISAAFAGWRGADPTCGPSSGRRSASGDLRYRYFLRPVAAGRAADLAAKKARKISGIFKPQLPGYLINRAIGKQQQPLRLA